MVAHMDPIVDIDSAISTVFSNLLQVIKMLVFSSVKDFWSNHAFGKVHVAYGHSYRWIFTYIARAMGFGNRLKFIIEFTCTEDTITEMNDHIGQTWF